MQVELTQPLEVAVAVAVGRVALKSYLLPKGRTTPTPLVLEAPVSVEIPTATLVVIQPLSSGQQHTQPEVVGVGISPQPIPEELAERRPMAIRTGREELAEQEQQIPVRAVAVQRQGQAETETMVVCLPQGRMYQITGGQVVRERRRQRLMAQQEVQRQITTAAVAVERHETERQAQGDLDIS